MTRKEVGFFRRVVTKVQLGNGTGRTVCNFIPARRIIRIPNIPLQDIYYLQSRHSVIRQVSVLVSCGLEGLQKRQWIAGGAGVKLTLVELCRKVTCNCLVTMQQPCTNRCCIATSFFLTF